MSARYYDPATGRFISQDTYTGTPYAPWTQHLYSYCGNNPVNMVDPTGHMPMKPIAVCDGGTTHVVPEPEPTPEPTPTPKAQEEHSRPGRIPAMILLKLPKPHMLPEEAKFDLFTSMGSFSPYGPPNSSAYSSNGFIKRFFGQDGRAELDIDLTNHKRPKAHPDVPHKHKWRWDEDGESHRGKGEPLSEKDYELLDEKDYEILELMVLFFGVTAANYYMNSGSALMNKSSFNMLPSTGGSSGMGFIFNGCGSDYFAYGIR